MYYTDKPILTCDSYHNTDVPKTLESVHPQFSVLALILSPSVVKNKKIQVMIKAKLDL